MSSIKPHADIRNALGDHRFAFELTEVVRGPRIERSNVYAHWTSGEPASLPKPPEVPSQPALVSSHSVLPSVVSPPHQTYTTNTQSQPVSAKHSVSYTPTTTVAPNHQPYRPQASYDQARLDQIWQGVQASSNVPVAISSPRSLHSSPCFPCESALCRSQSHYHNLEHIWQVSAESQSTLVYPRYALDLSRTTPMVVPVRSKAQYRPPPPITHPSQMIVTDRLTPYSSVSHAPSIHSLQVRSTNTKASVTTTGSDINPSSISEIPAVSIPQLSSNLSSASLQSASTHASPTHMIADPPPATLASSLVNLQTHVSNLEARAQVQARVQEDVLRKLPTKLVPVVSESCKTTKYVDPLTDAGNWKADSHIDMMDQVLAELGLPTSSSCSRSTSTLSSVEDQSILSYEDRESEPHSMLPSYSDENSTIAARMDGILPAAYQEVFQDTRSSKHPEQPVFWKSLASSCVSQVPVSSIPTDSFSSRARLDTVSALLTTQSDSSTPISSPISSDTAESPTSAATTSLRNYKVNDLLPPFDYGTDPYSISSEVTADIASSFVPVNNIPTAPTTSSSSPSSPSCTSAANSSPTPAVTSPSRLKAAFRACYCHYTFTHPFSPRYINTLWAADIANQRSNSYYYD